MNKRRKHSANFKAKVALEAAKNENTLNQIASKYQLHPAQVSQWKGELLDGIETIFESPTKFKNSEQQKEKEIAQLHQKIGQLTIENDWLKKKLIH